MPIITDYRVNEALPRTSSVQVYQQIISDLKDAQSLLSVTSPTVGTVRPNKWAATGLMARVYLYQKEWANAEAEASKIIDGNVFSLVNDLNTVFLADSKEAIWSLMPVNTFNTAEGATFVPSSATVRPPYVLTNVLLNSFETNDKRGQSLSRRNVYQYLGVDPQTGIFQFQDVNNDGLINTNDRILFDDLDPDYYGGLNNSLTYKQWSLDLFFEFKKQLGSNLSASIYASSNPGGMSNVPEILTERWHKPGDQSAYQKVSTSFSSDAAKAAANYALSSGQYSDASFIRLKNLSLGYALPARWIDKLHLSNARFYMQGQNLLTVTGYKYLDPETQLLNVLPPLRTLTAGIQVSL